MAFSSGNEGYIFLEWNQGTAKYSFKASECFVLSIEKDRQAEKHAEKMRSEELRLANARAKKAEMEQKAAGEEQFPRTCKCYLFHVLLF